MRITQNMSADNALYNIQKGRARLDRIQEQIASEVNYLRPSDDPISTRYILDLENKIKESTQYVKNIQNANIWVSITDNALTGMSGVLTQAKATVSNILGGSNDTTLTKMAVGQLTELKKQLIDFGNTQSGDNYIFGGFRNDSPPFKSNVWTMGVTVAGATVTVGDTANLKVGMPVTQPGSTSAPNPPVYIQSIDSGTQVTLTAAPPAPVNGFLTFGMETQLTGTTSTTSKTVTGVSLFRYPNITLGMKVTDPDGTHVPPWIPPNTVVTAIDRKNGTITLSNTPITAGNAPLSFTLPNAISGKTNTGSNVISNIFDTSNLKPGMTVTGQGIPPNTTILKVDSSNKITLSSSSLQTIDGVMLSYGYDGSVAGSVTGNATNGSVYLNEIQVPAGGLLVKGMPITGLGIQDGTTIDSYNPATGPLIGTLTSGTTLIQAIDTSNLAPGMPISGTGIPFGAYVSEIVNPGVAGDIRFETAYGSTANFTGAVNDLQFNSSITMSKPAINDSSFGLMGDSQNLSNQLINIADTGNVLVGMTVTGGGFPVGTVVTAKTANSITLNNMAGASASVNTTVMFSDSPFTLPLSGDVTPAIPATNPGTIANIFDTTNMKSGMTISGIGIPPGTTITNITGPHSVQLLNPIATPVAGSALVISLSGDTAIGSKTISNIYDTSSLNIGMPISGKGIPADTYIESITDSHTIVLSHNATANATQTLLDRPLAGNTQVGSKVVDGLFSTSGLLVGMPVAGTNIPDGSVITDINSPTSISISNAATGTGKQLGVTFAVDRDYTSYYGTDDDINVNIDNGVSFTMNLHGGQLLRGEASPSGTSIPGKMDIIKVLDDLITAISTNDSAAILKGVNDLKLSNDQINDAVAEVAGKTLRLDSAEKMHNRTENTLKGLISQRQGLDLTKAGVEMTKETTAYEAALSSTAKIAQISILDYIR